MRTKLVRLAGFAAGMLVGRAVVLTVRWLWREEIGQQVWAERNTERFPPWQDDGREPTINGIALSALTAFPEGEDRLLGAHWYRKQATPALDRELANLRTAMKGILRDLAAQRGVDE